MLSDSQSLDVENIAALAMIEKETEEVSLAE